MMHQFGATYNTLKSIELYKYCVELLYGILHHMNNSMGNTILTFKFLLICKEMWQNSIATVVISSSLEE